MTVFAASDLHLLHRNMSKEGLDFCNRPGDTVAEMTENVITVWNETVRPGDTVYVLGDFAMGKLAESLPMAGRMHGTKILVLGNHDRPFENGKRLDEYQQFFMVLGVGPFVMDFGRDVLVSHFPYTPIDRHDDRYTQFSPPDDGLPLLHGHIHDAWQVRKDPGVSVQVNVGIDAWDLTPQPIDALVALMAEHD